jgi:hypothetical protein
MRLRMTSDRWLGLVAVVSATAIVFVWVPLDTGSGYLLKVRRSVSIGDALGPTVAGLVILMGGLLTVFESKTTPGLTWRTLAGFCGFWSFPSPHFWSCGISGQQSQPQSQIPGIALCGPAFPGNIWGMSRAARC